MSKAKPKATRKPSSQSPERTVSKALPYTLTSTLKPEETAEAHQAEFMIEGLAMNAVVGLTFSTKLGTLDLTECFAQMLRSAKATVSGNTKSQEAILAGQIISTNALYTDLAMMARQNLDKGLDVFERLLRLALKAQSNCRATAETLAAMQNPPAVFARQANIATGPQQINNGHVRVDRIARAKKSDSTPNKLLEANGERLVGGKADSTGDRDQDVATVAEVDRSSKRRR